VPRQGECLVLHPVSFLCCHHGRGRAINGYGGGGLSGAHFESNRQRVAHNRRCLVVDAYGWQLTPRRLRMPRQHDVGCCQQRPQLCKAKGIPPSLRMYSGRSNFSTQSCHPRLRLACVFVGGAPRLGLVFAFNAMLGSFGMRL